MKTLDQLIPKFGGIKSYEADMASVNPSSPVDPQSVVKHVERDVNRVHTSDAKLRQESNDKRLKTLNEKLVCDRRQQSVVNNAINDSLRLNKRIVFNEDLAEEDHKHHLEVHSCPQMREESNKCSDNMIRKSKQLFDSDSDEDNDDNGVTLKEFDKKINDFNAEKLIALNSRFAHDSRFRIDHRFLDQLQDNDTQVDEKHKNMTILEEVLGKKFDPIMKRSDNLIDRKSEVSVNNLFVSRFDPKNEKSSVYEVSSGSDRKISKKVTFDETIDKTDQKSADVSKEVYYEVSADLMKTLANKDQPFSLTQMFGSHNDCENSTTVTSHTKDITFDKLNNNGKEDVLPNPFKYDSSSDDDDDHQLVINRDEDNTLKKVNPKQESNYFQFFFLPNDGRLREDVFYSEKLVQKARNESKDRQVMLMRAISVRKRSAKKNKKSDQKMWIKSKNKHNYKRFKR